MTMLMGGVFDFLVLLGILNLQKGVTMFEKLTECSRGCIFYSRYQASQLRSGWIEIDHVLLGLIQQDEKEEVKTLPKFLATGQTPEMIRERIFNGTPWRENCPLPQGADLPLSAEFKQVLAKMFEYGDSLQDTRMGLEYFLWGILKGPRSAAQEVLLEFGVTLEAVETHIAISRCSR